jgi:hypothetical protein
MSMISAIATAPPVSFCLSIDGAADRGKRVLEKIVNEVRHRRVLSRLPATSAAPNRRR